MMTKIPQIDLRPTPQNVQDRRRTEILMELEEEQQKVPQKIRALIQQQLNPNSLRAVVNKINREYAEGRLSDKLLKRCGTWVSRRSEELRTVKETH